MAKLIAKVGGAAALLLGLAALVAPPSGASAYGGYGGGPFGSTPIGFPHLPFSGTPKNVCGNAAAGHASCLSWFLPNSDEPSTGSAAVVSTPTGLSPTVIDQVYGFSNATNGGAGQTIGIVDAYDDPSAAKDLAHFSTQYGLPTATFTKVSETGSTTKLPAANSSWDLEISLDIEWAHAIAPYASILLVEASSSSLSDLMTAEKYASAHANYVSNSWGASEFRGETSDDSDFTAPSGRSVSYFAATGDSGGAVEYPAVSPNVVAVGGTSLQFTNSNVLASETAWSDGGGGCSSDESAPSAQASFGQYSQVDCSGKRAVPDVSFDADPNSGVSVYDSTTYDGSSGWWTVGGTSVATPIWAAESAAALGTVVSPTTIYTGSSIPYREIVSGNNGHPALVGYNLATGRGSWAYTPGTLTGLTATAGSGVTLSWTAPLGSAATSYNVWRGASSGGETELVTGVTGTSYADGSAVSGTKYFYDVQGVDSSGTGPYSNEAFATASGGGSGPALPGAPTGLTAGYASSEVSLSWTAPTSSVVSSYTILRGTSPGGESSTPFATGITSASYTDTTANTPGTTYYYEVEAKNTTGTGPASNEAFATASGGGSGPALPGAPTGLTAGYASSEVSLSWTAPTSSVVSSYTILRGTSPGGESSTPFATGITSASYTDTTANTPGTTYYYEVEAKNTTGTGPASNEAFATVPSSTGASVPTASFSVSCSLGGACTFTSTSTDSGGTITSYLWSGTGGLSGTTPSISHTYPAPGSDSVKLTVTDNNGHSGSYTYPLTCMLLFGVYNTCY